MTQTKELRISEGITLPVAAVTQRGAILGRTGSGKSYTLRVLVEEFSRAGLPVVVLDPMGAFYGLRSSADGKKTGIPITILGGEHGDLPLEPTAGALVADVVVEHPGAYIIDLSAFDTDAEEDRFAEAFAYRLFRAKAKHKAPMCLIVDEADRFAPQRPYKGQERMLGAFNTLSRRARQRGLGVFLATQRPASLNKHVLTQAELLVVHQVTGPQDRDAIDEWVRLNGTKEQRDAFLQSLSELERGEAWVWSPSWLRVFKRVRIRKARTFDSSKTPEPGDVPVEPKQLAAVELERLRKRMTATIEKAEKNDPAKLTKRIRELERELRTTNQKPVATKPVVEIEVPVVPDGMADALFSIDGSLSLAVDNLASAVESLRGTRHVVGQMKRQVDRIVAAAGKARAPSPHAIAQSRSSKETRAPERTSTPGGPSRPESNGGSPGDGPLPMGERRVLTAIAQHSDGVTREQLSVLAGYKKSTRDLYVRLLAQKNLVVTEGGRIRATVGGEKALGADFEPLPTGLELQEYWLRELPEGEKRILRQLLDAYPDAVDRDTISETSGYKKSTRDLYIRTLKARQLAVVSSSGVKASPTLYEEA